MMRAAKFAIALILILVVLQLIADDNLMAVFGGIAENNAIVQTMLENNRATAPSHEQTTPLAAAPQLENHHALHASQQTQLITATDKFGTTEETIDSSGLFGTMSGAKTETLSEAQTRTWTDAQAGTQTEAQTRTWADAQTEALPNVQHKTYSEKYDSVNGIELTDTPETVISKKGEPLQIIRDPDLPYLQTFEYDEMNIGFFDDDLQYVEIPQSSGSLELGDGTNLSLTIDDIYRILGEPDYTAEDGIVYRDGHRMIKFYVDFSSEQISSAHYFHFYSA